MELIEQLTQSLGVDQEQAKGGAGLIFQLAQQQLGDGEFAKVANVVPQINELLGAAPQEGSGLVDAIGGLASAFGGGGAVGKFAGLASVAAGFSQLGLKPDMVSQFLPIILSFVQNQGGDGLKDILAGVLK